MAVTRADVARAAGVSPSVVSYVLIEGMRPVAKETRERVLRAIEELGYRPNVVAQALQGSQTRSIGLLVPDYRNPFYVELANAIEDLAFAADHVMIVGSTGGGAGRQNHYVRAMVDRKVDGLILLASGTWAELETTTADGLPVVVLDHVRPEAHVSTVISDERGGARLGVAHLLDQGYRRIACIGGPDGATGAELRIEGWRDALAAHGSEPGPLVRSPMSREGGREAARALLAAGPPADAVFVSSDVQSVGLLSELHSAGVDLPARLAVVSFDGTDLARYAAPALTAVEQPLEELAETAMRRLMERIRGDSDTETHDVLEPRLVVRASTPPAASASAP